MLVFIANFIRLKFFVIVSNCESIYIYFSYVLTYIILDGWVCLLFYKIKLERRPHSVYQ